MIKNYSLFTTAYFTIILFCPLYAFTNNNPNNDEPHFIAYRKPGELSFMQSNNEYTDMFADYDAPDFYDIPVIHKASIIMPSTIIDFLLKNDILSILQEDFFLKTNRINNQSLLDCYLIGNQHHISTQHHASGFDLFYNQTSKGYFTKHSTSLSSYLNLTGQSLIDRIECCLDQIRDIFSDNNPFLQIQAAKILALFQDISLQQRRLGGFFYHIHRINDLIMRFKLPFYYLERNFFLTNSQRMAIAQEFGESTPEQEAEFRKKYFVSDKVGFGDLRFEIESPLKTAANLDFHIGGYATIPTAFALKKGMLGSSFAKPSTVPALSLFEKLFALAEDFINNPNNQGSIQEQAFTLLQHFFLDSFNRAAAALLETPLGNDGHVGIGLFTHTRIPLSVWIKKPTATKFNFINKTSLEYLFPASEKRFFIHVNNPDELKKQNIKENETDPIKSAADLKFIEQMLVDRFFLVAYETRVQPGIILHSTNTLLHQGDRWGWSIGVDNYLQTKDHFLSITVPPCPNTIPKKDLDLAKAKPFLAYKTQLGGGMHYQREKSDHSLAMSLAFDTTLFNSGIGKDFTLLFKIECHY